MARTRTARVPKAKPAPVTFEISDEIASVAAALMARFEAHYQSHRQFRIAYVMVLGGRQPKNSKIDGNWAKLAKQQPIQQHLHGYDLVLWIRQSIWKVLDQRQRQALVAHQLDHYTTNDKGDLVAQSHDVEDFAFVARHWGTWHENVELYGKQLSLFGQPDPKGNGHADAFADIDAQVEEQKAERDNVTQLRRPTTPATDQPGAPS